MWNQTRSKLGCQNIAKSSTSSESSSSTAGAIISTEAQVVLTSQEILSATSSSTAVMEDDIMPKDVNSLRTWPISHNPSRGQVRSCIEFSPSVLLPATEGEATVVGGAASTGSTSSLGAVAITSSAVVVSGVGGTPSTGADGSPIIRDTFANFAIGNASSGISGGGGGSSSLRGIPQTSASSHDITGAASTARLSFISLREGSSSTIPRQNQPRSASLSNPFIDLNLLDFDLPHSDNDEVNTPSGRETSMAASCDESCASGASGMSSNIEADSLEDLHRQQDQEFQDLLEDFAEQQFELEQRKPCTSHTSLSLSSLVSGDGDTTSESSCGTLSEVFDSLSRFSQHCLVSMEEALTISSPLYHHHTHTQSSSFTTTPTAERGDFEFTFDYEPPPSSTGGLSSGAGVSQSSIFNSALAQQVIYENQEEIERQRERDLMHVIPRRRLSSLLDASGQSSLEGGTGAVGTAQNSLSDQLITRSEDDHLYRHNNDLRAQRVKDWSAYGNNSSSGIASCDTGGPSNATSLDIDTPQSGMGIPHQHHHDRSRRGCGSRRHVNKCSAGLITDSRTKTTWSTMSSLPTASTQNSSVSTGGEGNTKNGKNNDKKENSSGGRGDGDDDDGSAGDSCHSSSKNIPIDIGFDFDLFVSSLGFRNVSSANVPSTSGANNTTTAIQPSSACLIATAAGTDCGTAPASSQDCTSTTIGTIENSLLLRAAAAAVSMVQGESGQVLVTPMDWQERCVELELALQRFGEQAARVRLLLRDKLAELERRVVEAETRAEDAEDKVEPNAKQDIAENTLRSSSLEPDANRMKASENSLQQKTVYRISGIQDDIHNTEALMRDSEIDPY